MNFLLDTHTFLWFIADDANLSAAARSHMEQPENGLYLSIASLWEMAIKVSLGKLDIPTPFPEFILRQVHENSVTLLDIRVDHVGVIAELPFHHRDPFDRLLIAQSLRDDLPIISRDALFDAYGIARVW
jgi:PIN domain nuclease of toxin-antitoxin system